MRENCAQQFEEHWSCLEKNNHVRRQFLCIQIIMTCFLLAILLLPQARTHPQLLHVRETGVFRLSLSWTMLIWLDQGLLKTIPGTPEGKKPIHEIEKPIIVNVQK